MVAMKDQSGVPLAVGRFAGWEPFGFQAGDTNWYRFVNNSPYNGTDAYGLLQVGSPHASYSEDIATLDSFIADSTPYADLAKIAPRDVPELLIKYPPMNHAGVWSATNRPFRTNPATTVHAGALKDVSFLFFVTWPYCEEKEGEVRLFLDETGSRGWRNGIPDKGSDGKNHREITNDPEVRTATLRKPWNGYTKVLIYMDVPGGLAVLQQGLPFPAMDFKIDLFQTFEVKDATGNTLSTFRHNVTIATDARGNITAHP